MTQVMTAPGSKQDKDNLCEFIFCVQRTFIFLSHECYFPRTCIRLCLACLNVHCMCVYMIVCVCALVWMCVWVCLCLYVHLDSFLDWCYVFDLGMYKTHMVIALFQLRLVPIHDGSTDFATSYGPGMDREMWSILDDFAQSVKSTDHSKTLWRKKVCKGQCLCRMLELPCTELCKCNGSCEMVA